jgi:hypothetical protein
LPIGKKTALVQWAASAASTAGIARPRPVVEGEHDLARPQEIVALEMLEAEAGPPVVSISMVRATPSALALPAQAAGGGGGGAGSIAVCRQVPAP